jgi:serine phosphatase RsbU (regulator of sigma subunit)
VRGDDLRGVRLLLVEDDEADAVLVREQLADSGGAYELEERRTLAEALAPLGDGVDCVLLDLHLPDAEGLQTLARVREASPGTPVIVLTGLADEEAGVAAVDAGAQDYLIKGQVGGGTLARAIRYAVGRRQAEDSRRLLEIAELRAQENARLARGLLPGPILDGAGVAVASCSRPGRRRALLGGDFFDVVQTDDGVIHALIGDVCGQGPDEAALGVALRSSWRALVLSGADGARVMSTLERIVRHERHLDSLFATVCALEVDVEAGRVRMRRAGHLPPMLIAGGTASILPADAGGRPLGLGAHAWRETEVALPDAWALLLYTDGLIEGRREARDRLGEEPLRALVAERLAGREPAGDPAEALERLVEHVEAMHGGPLQDDVALLLLESRGDRPREV